MSEIAKMPVGSRKPLKEGDVSELTMGSFNPKEELEITEYTTYSIETGVLEVVIPAEDYDISEKDMRDAYSYTAGFEEVENTKNNSDNTR